MTVSKPFISRDKAMDSKGRVYDVTTEGSNDGVDDEYKSITVSLIDTNLLSGSSDVLRNNLGGYFKNKKNNEGMYGTPPPFIQFDSATPKNTNLYAVTTHYNDMDVAVSRVLGMPTAQSAISLGYGSAAETMYDQKTVLPSVTFVVRIEGDPLSPNLTNVLEASKYWKTLFTGGSFDNQNIKAIYNQGAYDDHYVTMNMPYTALEKNYLYKGAGITQVVGVRPQYNRHFSNYQNFYSNGNMSERTFPNWYRIQQMGNIWTKNTLLTEGGIYSFPTVEEKNERCTKLFDGGEIEYYTAAKSIATFDEMNSIVSPGPDKIVDINTPYWSEVTPENPSAPQYKDFYEYFNTTLPAKIPTVSYQTMQRINNRNRNIIFNHHASTEHLSDTSAAMEQEAAAPYYMRVDLPQLNPGTISEKIVSREASAMIMRTLKESFLLQTDNRVDITSRKFLKNSRMVTSSADRSENRVVTTSEVVQYRTADFVKMILYAYDNVMLEHEDFCILDYQTLETKAAEDKRGLYRNYNSRNLSLLLADVLGTFGTEEAVVAADNLFTLYNVQNAPDAQFTGEPASRYNEILAYRVQKTGGPPVPDNMTQDVLQNFWIFNVDPETHPEQVLIDSQVKYGREYTYKIFAYCLVKGFKWRYKGLQVSRVIGQVREDGYTGPLEYASGLDGGPPEPPTAYCIEYYNPFTSDATEDLMKNTRTVYGTAADLDTSRYSTEAQRAAVSSVEGTRVTEPATLTTTATVESTILPPYVANIILTVQPSLRVIEIPLITKKATIEDNPPNELDIVPAYTVGNTNRLTFDIAYQAFSPQSFPRAINAQDVKRAVTYLDSNDITAYQMVDVPSRSLQRLVQVYRLDSMPSSFRDFDTVVPRTVSLEVDGADYSYTTATFNDIVKSNHKYYYLFRALNANNIAGNVDTIICAELVNDGGYKYAIFDTKFEEDLLKESHEETVTQFGKILQLIPPLRQTRVTTSDADLNKPAGSQYNNVGIGTAEDLIWDKTFKIRLTSKKTGKKIDLNITYNEPDQKLEEYDTDFPEEESEE